MAITKVRTMSVQVNPPIRVGDRIFAAVSTRHVAGQPLASAMMIVGRKTPQFILCLHGEDLAAWDLDGTRLGPSEIEHRMPGVADQLRAVRDQRAASAM
jgi:hypothetical protein